MARIANLTALRRQLQERYADRVKSLDPEPLPVVSMDDRFLQRCREIIDEHIEEDLSVAAYARKVGLSRGQLHRKLKALTDLGPREFIRTHRLHRAAELLRGRYGNVTEVAWSVGFKSLSHFTRCFRDQFGIKPSSYPDGDPEPTTGSAPEE
jgi:AraC-like DNA-binding protein